MKSRKKTTFLFLLLVSIFLTGCESELKPQWEHKTISQISTAPVSANGNVFIATDDHIVTVISAKQGDLMWKIKMPSKLVVKDFATTEKTVFLSTTKGDILALDIKTRMISLFLSQPISSYLLAKKNTLFICRDDGKVIAFDLIKNELKWETQAFFSLPTSSPAYFKRKLLVGTEGAVYIFDSEKGAFIKRLKLKNNLSNEMVYVNVAKDATYLSTTSGVIFKTKTPYDKVTRFTKINGELELPFFNKDRFYFSTTSGLYIYDTNGQKLKTIQNWKDFSYFTATAYKDVLVLANYDKNIIGVKLE